MTADNESNDAVYRTEPSIRPAAETTATGEWRPAWFGRLAAFANLVRDHEMPTIRESIARGRAGESP